MIEVKNLRKVYGGFTAVEGSSFSVPEGEVFGVIGPNGAGKTTTLKMLSGLVEPTSGSATVAGYDARDPEMRRHLGFLPEESPLYEDMTAVSYLEFFADLYDVPGDVATERIHDTLDRLDLQHRDRKIGDMSKGMTRKVAIARSLVNDPDVLIYDEPASGLDPLTTNYIIEFTRDLAESGKTVVFSAHNLFHVESICDRVAVMNDGRIVARGSVEHIREEHGRTEYRVYTTVEVAGATPVDDDTAVGDAPRTTEAAGQTGASAKTAGAVRGDERGRYCRVVESMDAVEETRELAEAAGGEVADIQTHTPSLEDIFLDLARESPGVEGRP
ncbi:ABC transporter ATP-binding protein [Halorussus sp. AFM4]|uniref:ABC transporter ATP-binding protein n=1 Tax=Halorussus sp. AFM4 TaxID=3421651 RepID=UPI003EBE57D7